MEVPNPEPQFLQQTGAGPGVLKSLSYSWEKLRALPSPSHPAHYLSMLLLGPWQAPGKNYRGGWEQEARGGAPAQLADETVTTSPSVKWEK